MMKRKCKEIIKALWDWDVKVPLREWIHEIAFMSINGDSYELWVEAEEGMYYMKVYIEDGSPVVDRVVPINSANDNWILERYLTNEKRRKN